ncbi:MAG: RIP metalloprotease RseP [SAR324 cluster bacterium]|nr:RIP metalloprotease RseP [SAR324 cluster bacterium]
MFTVITFILSLSLLVFLHELGHYMAARYVGVSVEEFSIGLPPKAISKRIGETDYCLSWLPIGGYVKLKGLDTEDRDDTDPTNYTSKTPGQKFLILIGGVSMNLIFAFVFMAMALMAGVNKPLHMTRPALVDEVVAGSVAADAGLQKNDLIVGVDNEPVATYEALSRYLISSSSDKVSLKIRRDGQVITATYNLEKMKDLKSPGFFVWQEAMIGAVREGSPAALGGLQKNDLIKAVDGVTVASWRNLPPLVQASKGKELELAIQREGRVIKLVITPAFDANGKYYYIGVSPLMISVQLPFGQAVSTGAIRVITLGKQTLGFVFQLISGKASSETLGGPIMIAQVMGQAAQKGASELLGLLAFISLQLGLFNLFPIPALDGGHIFILLIEKFKGSPLKEELKNRMTTVGFSALLFLILWVSIQDGLRLLS